MKKREINSKTKENEERGRWTDEKNRGRGTTKNRETGSNEEHMNRDKRKTEEEE